MVDNLADARLHDPSKVFNDICQKNSNRLVLNVNSLRNKSGSFSAMIKDNGDMTIRN